MASIYFPQKKKNNFVANTIFWVKSIGMKVSLSGQDVFTIQLEGKISNQFWGYSQFSA